MVASLWASSSLSVAADAPSAASSPPESKPNLGSWYTCFSTRAARTRGMGLAGRWRLQCYRK